MRSKRASRRNGGIDAPTRSPCRQSTGKAAGERADLLGRASSVDVVEPNDVVLVEIGGNLAGIGESMLFADRDVGRLVLAQHRHVSAARHLDRSGHHHPMLRSVMVAL